MRAAHADFSTGVVYAALALIPGLLGIRCLAHPRLGSHQLLPGRQRRALPRAAQPAAHSTALPNRITVYLFGFSGILDWLAVAVLAVNLWMTMLRAPP